MRTTIVVSVWCLLAMPVVTLNAQQEEKPTVPQLQKPDAMSPVKAKPVQKPKSTTARDKVSVSGYGEDPGEETQERPNPLNKQGVTRPDPIKGPLR